MLLQPCSSEAAGKQGGGSKFDILFKPRPILFGCKGEVHVDFLIVFSALSGITHGTHERQCLARPADLDLIETLIETV